VTAGVLALASIAFLGLVRGPVLAQERTGQIKGTVFDSQGAALAGVEVAVTNSTTSFTGTTVTESQMQCRGRMNDVKRCDVRNIESTNAASES
jgi:hypothetical protein